MKAFLVRVNGKRLCKAGIGPNGVLAAIVNWVGGGPRRSRHGHFTFHLGGLDSRSGEHVDWFCLLDRRRRGGTRSFRRPIGLIAPLTCGWSGPAANTCAS